MIIIISSRAGIQYAQAKEKGGVEVGGALYLLYVHRGLAGNDGRPPDPLLDLGQSDLDVVLLCTVNKSDKDPMISNSQSISRTYNPVAIVGNDLLRKWPLRKLIAGLEG
jgi:hypothetical protein